MIQNICEATPVEAKMLRPYIADQKESGSFREP